MLNYAAVIVSLAIPVATLGLDSIIVRDLVNHTPQAGLILGTGFSLKFLGALVALLASMLIAAALGIDDYVMYLMIVAYGSALIFHAFDVVDFWFQSRQQVQFSVIARTTSFGVVAILKILLLLFGGSVLAFAWLGFIETFLAAIALTTLYISKGNSILTWRLSRRTASDLFRVSWPLMISAFAISIYMKIDQIMLAEMVGQSSLGIYSAAVRISEICYFIPIAITTSIFPSVIRARSVDTQLYYQRLQKLFDIMVLLAVAIALPMTFLSDTIVTTLFGNDYQSAAPILSVHIWAGIFVFIGVAQTSWDAAEGTTRLAMARTIFGSTVNILLNALLIPRLGGLGAAVATVIAYACSAWLANSFSYKTRTIFLMQTKALFPLRFLLSVFHNRHGTLQDDKLLP